MSTKLKKLSLKDNYAETLLETEDCIFSIAFCKETNGIFYSNFTKNNISMFALDKKDVVLYKEDNIMCPKSICFNEDHTRLFYEDNADGISGFYVKNALVFSWTAYGSGGGIESQQDLRNIISKDFVDMKTKVNCIDYVDDLEMVFISRCKKHSVDCINNFGRICKLIGSGKADFCSSTNPLNVSFNCPTGLCFVASTNELFVADTNNHILRHFSKNNGWKELQIIGIPTQEGSRDGKCADATFRFPSEICNFGENIFIIDDGNKIRRIDANKNEVTTVRSTGNFIKSVTCDKDSVYWAEW